MQVNLVAFGRSQAGEAAALGHLLRGRDVSWLGKGKTAGWQPLLRVSSPPANLTLVQKRGVEIPRQQEPRWAGCRTAHLEKEDPSPKVTPAQGSVEEAASRKEEKRDPKTLQ